jgi:hypothetical protein
MRKVILINAVIWAALILGSALLFKDHPHYFYSFGGLIVASGFTNALLVGYARKRSNKCLW